MDDVKAALIALKQSFQSRKKKDKKAEHFTQVIANIESHLVLLNSSNFTNPFSDKLAQCLRQPLIPIYAAHASPGLQLVAALSKVIYEEKILPEYKTERFEQKTRFEAVLNSLLSGVLDFLDDNGKSQTKNAIGLTLYPVLCSFGFSPSMPAMGIQLRCLIYTLLAESASAHKANQERLRIDPMAGGSNLGILIWRTKDFLVLESLLNLFARMMPSTKDTPSGRASRMAFIRSVFVSSSSENAATGEKIAKLLEKTSTSEWDPIAVKILEILASSNLAFPQPFVVKEITSSGRTKPLERLYIDNHGFCANIILEDDAYESLEIPYANTKKVKILFNSLTGEKLSKPSINIYATTPPLVGMKPMSQTGDAEEYAIIFSIDKQMVPKFQEALVKRGLGERISIQRQRKQSVAASPAVLEIINSGKLVEKDQRYENLTHFYNTNNPSDDLSTDSLVEADDIPCSVPAVAVLAQSSSSKSPEPAARQAIPSRRTEDQKPRDTVAQTSSEISEIEFTQGSRRTRKQTTAIAKTPSRDNGSKNMSKKTSVATTDLDSSDDENALESKPTAPNKCRKQPVVRKNTVLSDDEIQDSSPLASKIPVSARRPSLSFVSVAPPVPISFRSVSKSLTKDAMISSEDPANDTGSTGSPPAKASELPGLSYDSVSSPATDLPAVPIRANVLLIVDTADDDDGMKPVARLKDPGAVVDYDELPSSTPVPQSNSIKSRLRRKDGTVTTNTATTTTRSAATKRKRIETADQGDFKQNDTKPQERPKKRTKPDAGTTMPLKDPREDDRSHKVAAARPIKRYGGRKRINSSSPGRTTDIVDYDAIPNGPLPVSMHDDLSQRSPPVSRTKTLRTKAASKKNAKTQPASGHMRSKPVSDVDELQQQSAVHISSSTSSSLMSDKMRSTEAKTKKGSDKAVLDQIQLTREHPAKEHHNKANELSEPLVQIHKADPEHPTRDDFATDILTLPKDVTPSNDKQQPDITASINKSGSDRSDTADLEETFDDIPAPLEDVFTIVQPTKMQESLKTVQNIRTAIIQTEPRAPVSGTKGTRRGEAVDTHQSHSASLPKPSQNDITMIDLTLDDSPLKASQVIRQTPPPAHTASSSARGILKARSPPNYDNRKVIERRRNKPFVTFSPELEKRSERKPSSTEPRSRYERDSSPTPAQKTPPGMEEIANVLDRIGDAILHRISGKFDLVRKESHRSKSALLADAIADLEAMRDQSIKRFNMLIHLEAEYEKFNRNVIHTLEDASGRIASSSEDLNNTIEQHDRAVLANRVPKSLFYAALPPIFKKIQG